MNNVRQRLNRQGVLVLSALTRLRRRLTHPLRQWIRRQLNKPRLKYPTNLHFEQQLRHWKFMGNRPLYEIGREVQGLQGTPGAFIKSTGVGAEEVATLRQTLKADSYRGKLLRFSGEVKVEGVEEKAGLYIRTSRRTERLIPENMLQGTHDWARYEAIIPVAEDAPSYTLAWLNKGDILRNLNRFEDALAAYEHALHLDPNNEGIKRNIQLALERLGRAK